MGFKPLSDLNINVYANWHTGAAYTPVDFRGNPLERGSGRMPSLFDVDLRLDKYFHPYENLELNFFVDVRNLFDIRNVVQVYTRTGEPDDNGNRPIWDPENTGAYSAYERWGYESEYDMYLADLEGWKRRVKVPSFYTNPRIIRTGLMIKF